MPKAITFSFPDVLNAALGREGKTFEYHWSPREGHGNAKLENRVDEWRRIEGVLARESQIK